MPRILGVLLLCLSLGGCAVCERHPVACAAGVAVVGGAVAYGLTHRHTVVSTPVAAPTANPCDQSAAAYAQCIR